MTKLGRMTKLGADDDVKGDDVARTRRIWFYDFSDITA